MTNGSENLRWSVSEGVLNVTLSRPERRNALNQDMIAALDAALARAEDDPSVRVVCLRAEGPVFCAGIDLKAAADVQARGEAAGRQDVGLLTQAILRLARLPRPTVAIADGAAFAAGVGLLAACDFVLGTPRVSVALTQVRNGLIPGFVAPLLAQAIGVRAARQIALSGDPLDAGQAVTLGLVTELHEPDAIEARLSRLLDSLRRGAPDALSATKLLMGRYGSAALDAEDMAGIDALVGAQRATAEAAEGMAAFREKRLPAWYAGNEG